MKQYSFLTENLLLEAPAQIKSMWNTFRKTAGGKMTQKGLTSYAQKAFKDQRARDSFIKYGLGRLGGQKVAQAKKLAPQIQTQLKAGGVGNQQLANKLTMQQNQLTNKFNNLKQQAQQFKKPLTGGGKGMSSAIDAKINKNAIVSATKPQVSVTNQQISNITNTLKPQTDVVTKGVQSATPTVKTTTNKIWNGLKSDTAKSFYKNAWDGTTRVAGGALKGAGYAAGGLAAGTGLLGAALVND
jgi:hypothetical protein